MGHEQKNELQTEQELTSYLSTSSNASHSMYTPSIASHARLNDLSSLHHNFEKNKVQSNDNSENKSDTVIAHQIIEDNEETLICTLRDENIDIANKNNANIESSNCGKRTLHDFVPSIKDKRRKNEMRVWIFMRMEMKKCIK